MSEEDFKKSYDDWKEHQLHPSCWGKDERIRPEGQSFFEWLSEGFDDFADSDLGKMVAETLRDIE
jgi:hypothetical protein